MKNIPRSGKKSAIEDIESVIGDYIHNQVYYLLVVYCVIRKFVSFIVFLWFYIEADNIESQTWNLSQIFLPGVKKKVSEHTLFVLKSPLDATLCRCRQIASFSRLKRGC